MTSLFQDLRHGSRNHLASPGFAFVVVATLALAIGANTVIFSFTNILALRPLPIADEERVGFVFGTDPQQGDDRAETSLPDFADWRERTTSWRELAARRATTYTLTGRGEPEQLVAYQITASLFPAWGLKTVRGRPFRAGEDEPGAEPVVVVSHHYWQQELEGDPEVVGEVLNLNGVGYTVVGVMEPEIEFGGLTRIDVWTPLVVDPAGADRSKRDLRVTGRLVPGVSIEQASAELERISRQLQKEHPDTNAGWTARAVPTREAITGSDTWIILGLLSLVVGGVLVIGCANVANLMLARTGERRRELAVRVAMGASRLRVVRQLLVESMSLGLAGGLAGLGVAHAGLRLIKAVAHDPFFDLVRLDPQVLLFGVALGALSPLLFALLPALQVARGDLAEPLKEAAGRTTGGRKASRFRSALVVAQLSLAIALTIVAALVVRTVDAIIRADWGFDQRGVVSFYARLPEYRYPTDDETARFVERLVRDLDAVPGVESAGAVDEMPFLGAQPTVSLAIAGRPAPEPKDRPWAVQRVASHGLLETLGIPVVTGRGFAVSDTADSAPVALVSREMARRYWPDGDPVGQRLGLLNGGRREPEQWVRVVGVTGDVLDENFEEGPKPTFYLLHVQHPTRGVSVVVRTGDPEAVVPAIRHTVRKVDPELAIDRIRTLQQTFDEDNNSNVLLSGMFASFAALALILAVTGLYSVIAYGVSQRSQEIGIRMTFGALGGDIVRLVVGQGVRLLAIGLVLGLLLGFAISRMIASLLYGVSASDPLTYASVAAVLAVVSLLASYLPARRAASLDPVETLRAE